MKKISTATWWKSLFVGFSFVVIADNLNPYLGHLEGYFFPVVSNATITRIDAPQGETYIDFSGTFEKYRDCDLVEYNWFMTYPDGYDRERFDVLIMNDRWRSRSVGPLEFGPRRAYVTEDELLKFAYAVVAYDCHPIYNTRNIFFQGSEVK